MKASALPFGILRLLLVSGLMALGLTACGGGSSKAVGLTGVELNPAAASKPLGTSQQYSATAIYSNNSTADVSGEVSWQSSNPSTVSISASGLAQTLKTGTVTISASYLGQSVSTTLTVTAAAPVSVAVTPANSTLTKGSSRAYIATATFTDTSVQDVTANASWASSSTTVATVSNTAGSRGLVTATGLGNSSISASFQGLSGSTGLTVTSATLVSIQVTPSSSTLPKGTSKQFTATGVYTDNSTQNLTGSATWSSSNPALASVGNATASKGLVSALAEGAVSISASAGGLVGSTGLTVTSAVLTELQITPASASSPKGTSRQFAATGIYSDSSTQDLTASVVWSSTAADVASISNAAGSKGLASALALGGTTIGAASGDISATTPFTVTDAVLTALQVTPADASSPKGTSRQFTATGIYSDMSTQDLTASVVWSSTAADVASISNAAGSKGLASALAIGGTTIGAASGDISATTPFTVTAAVLTGLQITPANASVPKGNTQQYTATGIFSDGSTQDFTAAVTWSSSAATVATISNASGSSGLASTSAEGSTTIGAVSGSISTSTNLQVTAAVLARLEVTPAAPSIPAGKTQQFTATGVYTDNSTKNLTATVTWSTSNSAVLDVSNSAGQQGLAAANQKGTATISAAHQGKTGSTDATVSDAVLSSIQVTPASKSLARGFSLQYTATGIYSDNSKGDITASVTWSSSNTPAVTISNADGSRGLATASGTNTGSSSIAATSGTLSGSTSLTVTAATLSSVAITPDSPSIPLGTGRQLTATGTFSDSTTQDLTTQASWSSSDAGKATVGNGAGSKGYVTSVAEGGTTIQATINNATTSGVSDSTTATISAAAVTSISVSPSNLSLADGRTQQYTATGTFTNNSNSDITASVTWASSNTAVATISNASDSTKGKATAAGTGSTTISATSGSVSGSTGLTVTAAVLESISIAATPANASIAAGRTQQYAATGTYSDGSTATITSSVTWTSSDTSVATISNASGSNGLATSSKAGSTQINAKSGSVTSNTRTLTVTAAVPTAMTISPKNQTIGNKTSLQFTASETFSDGEVVDQTSAVTWATTASAVADISNASGSKGLATAKSQGTTTISATDPNATSISASTPLTVGPAPLQSITVSSKSPSLPAGYKVQYIATGNYADGQQDLTDDVSWDTVNHGVATVSNTSGSQGLVTSVAAGGTSVVASFGGVTGQSNVSVTTATLGSIVVTPTGQTITNDCTLKLTATANFSNGDKLDVSINNGVNWSSSSGNTVSVDQTGLATGEALPGSANISATKGTVSGQTAVGHSFAASCTNM